MQRLPAEEVARLVDAGPGRRHVGGVARLEFERGGVSHSVFHQRNYVPQDDGRQAEKKIQGLTDGYVKKIDELVTGKEEEILQV